MATTFSRTTRALDADGFAWWAVGLLAVGVLLSAWCVWFTCARVSRIEVSQDARIEIENAARRIEPIVEGRIVVSHLSLGRAVVRGEVVAELDATAQVLELDETKRRAEGLEPEIARLRGQSAAEGRALEAASNAADAGVGQAKAQAREAEAASQAARADAARLERLHEGGIVSDMEFQRAKSEADRRVAAADAVERSVDRIAGEQRAQESERQARIEKVQSEISRLEAERRIVAATIDRLENEIERRRIRAPETGSLVDVSPVQAGAVVEVGQGLGTVLPSGDASFKVIAHFRPSEALGRVRPGQSAQVRLDGFPWMQFGSLVATVTSVAGEIRDDLVRVDVAIAPDSHTAIPLQHGLPGVVEIEVERVTPAELTLRAAGQLVTRPVERISGASSS